jgi:hypothetical protein
MSLNPSRLHRVNILMLLELHNRGCYLDSGGLGTDHRLGVLAARR